MKNEDKISLILGTFLIYFSFFSIIMNFVMKDNFSPYWNGILLLFLPVYYFMIHFICGRKFGMEKSLPIFLGMLFMLHIFLFGDVFVGMGFFLFYIFIGYLGLFFGNLWEIKKLIRKK